MTITPAVEPAPGAYDDLLPLADARMATLFESATVLDDVLRRLFDPREQDRTVSAFSSAL